MDDSSIKIPGNPPILVVDDEPDITEMISLALNRRGFPCMTAENANEALKLLTKTPFDVVITDIRMPGLSGVDLLKIIKEEYNADVMVMTGFTEEYDYESVIMAGAADFIQKPISFRELLIRLQRVLRLRYLMIERDQINRELKKNVEQLVQYSSQLNTAHQELQYAYLDTINRLVAATEYRDEDTGEHIVRISRYCTLMADKLGLPPEMVELIQYASPMHDIGKIGIPDHILLKSDQLTAEEFEIVKTHTTIGASILENSRAEVLKLSREIALTHHEKFNGKGYPQGLSGKDIPVSGRILAIADTFDALTSKRPYKTPYPFRVAVDIIKAKKGGHFDPEIVDIFIGNIEEIRRIKEEIDSSEAISLSDFIWSRRDIATGMDKKIMARLSGESRA
ncbi:MAG: response regulator [Desulfosalsimonadaceae bacterium]